MNRRALRIGFLVLDVAAIGAAGLLILRATVAARDVGTRNLPWLTAMIISHGVDILFAMGRGIVFALAIWLTVVIVNWHRDRDERRNVGEKEQRIIKARTEELDYWRKRARAAEATAGDRLAIIRASMGAVSHAAMQLRGAGEDAEPAAGLRKVKG